MLLLLLLLLCSYYTLFFLHCQGQKEDHSVVLGFVAFPLLLLPRTLVIQKGEFGDAALSPALPRRVSVHATRQMSGSVICVMFWWEAWVLFGSLYIL